MNKTFNFYFRVVLLSILLPTVLMADQRNILPCFPEIVIEKSYSQFFKVKDCQAKAKINNEIAFTELKAVLENVSARELDSSIKFRILYPTSPNSVSIKIDGKPYKYNPEDPRYNFKLKPKEKVSIKLNANLYINYSVDAVRKSIERLEEAEKAGSIRDVKKSSKEKARELSGSFLRYFKSNERYGKRFQVGRLVSKWGIFPVDFEKLSLEIQVPENYTIITTFESAWKDLGKSKKFLTYKTNDRENYSDAIFLPAADKEEQLETMKVLKRLKNR